MRCFLNLTTRVVGADFVSLLLGEAVVEGGAGKLRGSDFIFSSVCVVTVGCGGGMELGLCGGVE